TFNNKQNASTELTGVSGLSTTGYVQRTGAGTYSTTSGSTAASNNTLVQRDGSGVSNFYGVGVTGATSGTVTQRAPATVTSYSVTWPSAAAGAANSVLASDTSGNLSWINLGSVAGSINLTSQVTGALPIANGGTNATTAAGTRTNLGLGTVATLDSGSAAGNVPVLGTGGLVANQMCTSDGTAAGIICNSTIPTSSQWTTNSSNIYFNTGNVGIGTTTPGTKLEVTGSVRVGNGGETCGASYTGAIRYNSPNIEFCNGTAWTVLTSGAGSSYLSSSGGSLSGGLTISSGGETITAGGLTVSAGGIDANSTGITNAGSITGVGSNITGSSAVTIASGGTAQNLTLNSSTTGSVNVGSGNGTQLSVLDGGASTVNYVTVKGAAASGSPVIGTAGSDANINLTLTPKGTGNTIISSGNVGIGTTSPATLLTTNGSDNSTSSVPWYSSSSSNAAQYVNNTYNFTNITQGGSLTYGPTANFDQMLINPTSTLTGSPTGRFVQMTVPASATSNVSGTIYGLSSYIYDFASVGTSGVLRPGSFTSNFAGAATRGTLYGVAGNAAIVSNGSNQASTVSNLFAGNFNSSNGSTGGSVTGAMISVRGISSNSGTVANQYSIYESVSNSGTITNGYGIYITGEGSGGTWTNTPYDLYAADTGAYNYFAGNVGIGTTAPATKLEVTGSLRVGNGGETCGASYTGAIRYNSPNIEFCNGTAWTILTSGAGSSYLASSGGSLSGGLTISTGGETITAGGLTVSAGGINANSTGITNAGSITGVGSNITGSSAMTIASGGTAQNLTLNSSTTGSVNVGSGNGTQLSVLDGGASTVNYVTVKGAAASGSPVIGTAGSDTNINLTLTPKGTGNTIISSGNVGIGTTAPSETLQLNATISPVARSTIISTQAGINNTDTSTASASHTPLLVMNVSNASSNSLTQNYAGYVETNVSAASTVTYNNIQGFHSAASNSGSGTVTNMHGAYNESYNLNASATVTTQTGTNSIVQNSSTGTITNAYGVQSIVTNFTTGTITNAYGLNIPSWSNGGTIGTGYGVYLGTIAGTTNYGIYQSSSSNQNYFAGNVGIGTTSPASKLQVSGAVTNTVSTFSGAFTCGTSSIDFSTSNFQRLSPSNTIAAGSCTTTLSNLVAGGSYTLIVTGTAATNAVTYAFSGYTFKYLPANAATTAGKDTIYTFLYDGTTVYVTWSGGY
ncbi:MAG: beta strand repeat-containing protein, partial [Bdellovibrio sp.]